MDTDLKPEKKLLDAKEVKAHAEKGLKMVRLGDMVKSCVDGRDKNPIIGIPGGDSGLFIAMASTLEQTYGKRINKRELLNLFHNYQNEMGKFYVHSDSHAKHAEHDVIEKGGDIHEDCSCIGCGHLRLAMGGNKPVDQRNLEDFNEEYSVHPELVSSFFKMIDEEIASGNNQIESILLKGNHGEGAVVKIKTNDVLTPDSKIPAISPSVKDDKLKDQQMFVYHEQVAQYMLDSIVDKIKKISGEDIDIENFRKTLKEIFAQQLGATLGHLAKGLPVYEVSASTQNQEITVESKGNI